MSLTNILLGAAVLLLPATEQARFRQEWRAELAVVRETAGSLAALGLAARLVRAAPRMTMAMRANNDSGYAELSFGIIFSVFPAAVLAVLALQTGVWIMLVGELALIAGILLMASGFWSVEGRLFDSRRCKVGLVLAVIGSVVEVVVRRSTGFGPPIDAVVSATIPHTLILLGLILWVVSSYAGRFRFRVMRFAVVIMAPGAALNLVAVVINGVSLSGFDRFGVLMYAVPSAALAWACYSVVGRGRVFDDRPVDFPKGVEI